MLGFAGTPVAAQAAQADALVVSDEPLNEDQAAFEELELSYKEARDEVRAKIKASEDSQEKSALRKELKALPSQFFGEFDQLASTGNNYALVWTIKNARYAVEKDEVAAKKLALYEQGLARNPAGSGYEDVVNRLFGEKRDLGVENIDRLGSGLIANEELDPEIRALAMYRLGELLTGADDDETRARGVDLFTRLTTELPDTFWARQASGTIFEKTRLQIGMEAPDIVGEDLDGVEFKLSDYRGKVVLLDFWGDW